VTWAEILKAAAALAVDIGREALESRKAARDRAIIQAQAAALSAAAAKASSDAAHRGYK
jgi:hypothetical protein